MKRTAVVLALLPSFTLWAQTASINQLTPSQAPAGSADTSLSISGQNIPQGSTVSWTTPDGRKVSLSPSLVQAAQVAATIPAALLSSVGTAQVAVANPSGTLSNQLPFKITPPVAVSSTALADATVGSSYGPANLAATNGATPYTWSFAGGVLPGGLSLDPSGSVSGTPTTPGTFTFGAKVTDATGAYASATFTIKVAPAGLKITTPSVLTAGIAAFDYPVQVLEASGGFKPYSFSVTGGSLPTGLTLQNGQIAGTPTAAGTSNFTLTVTDASGTKASNPETVVIRPSTTVDLVLGSSSAAFSLTAGAAGVPDPVVIPIQSSAVATPLNFTVAVSSTATWVTATSGATTPGSITVALTSQALALSASPSPASVTVTCTSAACANKSQTITVTLDVSSRSPQLNVISTLLPFAADSTSPTASTETLTIQNSGGGSLAITSITSPDKWIQVGAIPASLPGGATAAIPITVNPTNLKTGSYRSSIDIVTSGGRAAVPVTLLVGAAGTLTLGPSGGQFNFTAGGPLGNPNGSFFIATTTSQGASYVAAVLPGADWLTIKGGSAGSFTAATPATVAFAIDPAASAALLPGTYYGTIRVSASGVLNSPQDYQVVLTVSPKGSNPSFPDPAPAGLLFTSTVGSTALTQNVQVFANSTATLEYQTAANVLTTANGAKWLSVSPATGFISSSAPGTSTVTVNPTGLPAGVYRGEVYYAYSVFGVRTVNVALIVTPSSGSARSGNAVSKAGACTPSQLVPAQLGPLSNFSTPASWPTPMSIRLSDDCGSAVTNGQVVATFSNGDPPLLLTMVDGSTATYSGTWTPRAASQATTISATATAPGFTASSIRMSGQVRPNSAPSIVPNGVTDIFNPVIGGSVAPGTVVQIFGDGFATQATIPTDIPLPTTAGSTSVLIGGIAAPLFYVGSGQINAQVPFELDYGKQYQVIVNANGSLSAPSSIQIDAAAPGILNSTSGQIYAQRPNGSFVSADSPAKPGENLVFYVLAMGATDNPVVSGTGAPGLKAGEKLANAAAQAGLTIGGIPAVVQFAGLTPGAVGLYQVNFQVPPNARTGNQEVILTQGDVVSNKTLLPIQP